MINSYLEKHYNEILRKFKGVTKNHPQTEDLLQDCILNFLEKGPDYISKILRDNKVQHYLVRMCYIQFNSKTSPFYTKYKKFSSKTLPITDSVNKTEDAPKEQKLDTSKLIKDIKLYIGNLGFTDKHFAQRHLIDDVSQREMSREYDINRIHISASIQRTKSNVQMRFNRDDYMTE
jgi:DNA-directed RNA polymerase specialized sigma24 family protein